MDTQDTRQNRYHRQTLLPQIGSEGQRRLGAAHVLLVGCGALGTALAEQLVRAGVGRLRIADRDIVELTNLQRQTLFDEEDVRQEMPKAAAAAMRLGRINSSISVESQVVDVHAGNIEHLARSERPAGFVNLILDGTDNIETRYLINDLAIQQSIPWIYGACIGTEGRVMAVRPGVTACLRCIFPQPPAPGSLPTCDTAGVLGPAATTVASIQAAIAVKLLTGQGDEIAPQMLVFDLWDQRFRSLSVAQRQADCPCCSQRQYPFLESGEAQRTVSLCGRNAVQVPASHGQKLDLAALASRLQEFGQVQSTPYFLRCQLRELEGITLTVFPDGRLIVNGTSDLGRARSIAARFVGS